MGFFERLFRKSRGELYHPATMPWDAKPSIYDHTKSHIETDTPGLSEGGESLPDEERASGSRAASF